MSNIKNSSKNIKRERELIWKATEKKRNKYSNEWWNKCIGSMNSRDNFHEFWFRFDICFSFFPFFSSYYLYFSLSVSFEALKMYAFDFIYVSLIPLPSSSIKRKKKNYKTIYNYICMYKTSFNSITTATSFLLHILIWVGWFGLSIYDYLS